MTADAFSRSSLEEAIRDAAHAVGVTLQMTENRGWTESTFRITATGEPKKVLQFNDVLTAMAD